MSPDDVIELFETMVDDAPDADEAAVLMDVAYTKRNDERLWSFLLKLDSTTIVHGSSDTWQTQHALPSDVNEPVSVFAGQSGLEYDPIPFEEILRWKGSSSKYSLDYLNNVMYFMGPASSALQIYFWYQYLPTSLIGLTDAQKALTTTIVWPKKYCALLAFDMASMHMGGIDADDTTRKQVPFLNAAHRALYSAMIGWDNRRRMKMRMNSATPRGNIDSRNQPDVVSGI